MVGSSGGSSISRQLEWLVQNKCNVIFWHGSRSRKKRFCATTMTSNYFCLPEECEAGMHIYWAATPSLITDPFGPSDYGYLAHQSMRCVDDFEYPSWPEFDRRLKAYEQHEKSDICNNNYYPTTNGHPAIMPRNVTEGEHLQSIMHLQTSQLQHPLLDTGNYLETGNYLASRPVSPSLSTSTLESRSSSPVVQPSRAGARAKQYEGLPVTVETIIGAFRELNQPFTFKRVMYMDWVKPHLLAFPPAQTGGTIESVFMFLPSILNSQEQEFLQKVNQFQATPVTNSEVETFLTSIANKLMLLHFFAHGTYQCNSPARNALIAQLGHMIYGPDLKPSDPQFQHIRKVLESRVKHFRDVMARQFKIR
eukprot:Protomagalhaensia_wolfi_Nauph_80__1385@NODE_182_length_3270_cov_138_750232_g137_i0_p1_GENE_NODE_182_length_3270_cov_138_750232_g137_i0NODE_182_length_3270_cov_138_750232_g137_i0_p1_ORF_typecomplete_len364_score30_83CHAT/PF12770_7/0_12PriCT_1/PF08708_11/0_42_NODE_182_length_3270_cov_138_750232_g137_i01701261